MKTTATTTTPKAGRKYELTHSRFGRATVKVVLLEGEWVDITVIKGTLRGLTENWGPGDSKAVRLAHCQFKDA